MAITIPSACKEHGNNYELCDLRRIADGHGLQVDGFSCDRGEDAFYCGDKVIPFVYRAQGMPAEMTLLRGIDAILAGRIALPKRDLISDAKSEADLAEREANEVLDAIARNSQLTEVRFNHQTFNIRYDRRFLNTAVNRRLAESGSSVRVRIGKNDRELFGQLLHAAAQDSDIVYFDRIVRHVNPNAAGEESLLDYAMGSNDLLGTVYVSLSKLKDMYDEGVRKPRLSDNYRTPLHTKLLRIYKELGRDEFVRRAARLVVVHERAHTAQFKGNEEYLQLYAQGWARLEEEISADLRTLSSITDESAVDPKGAFLDLVVWSFCKVNTERGKRGFNRTDSFDAALDCISKIILSAVREEADGNIVVDWKILKENIGALRSIIDERSMELVYALESMSLAYFGRSCNAQKKFLIESLMTKQGLPLELAQVVAANQYVFRIANFHEPFEQKATPIVRRYYAEMDAFFASKLGLEPKQLPFYMWLR